jgi:hypothetical protein
MKSEIRKTLIQKLNDALVAEIPELTRREIRLPVVPGKASYCCLAASGFRFDLSRFRIRVSSFVFRPSASSSCHESK